MTGTLEEKVERDVRAHPDDYSTAGKWLDDYSLSHGSRLKAKLLQKKKEFDESGIQKEATKFKRKARTAGTKKAKEAAERFARSCQSRKDDLTKLKKEIRAFDAYLKTPKGEFPVTKFVLIREALEYAFSEDPQDINKFLVIFWVLTDRFVDTTGPGLTRFEKWNYGDDRECAEPEEYFGTRHWTLDWLLSIFDQMIPTVEAAMRATTRNRETEQKVSGGKAGNTKRKKARKKTPPQLLKEVRERLAAQELAKDPNITAKILGEILGCDKSTVVRLKAWQKKNVLNSPLPKGFIKRTEDENYSTVEAINKPE